MHIFPWSFIVAYQRHLEEVKQCDFITNTMEVNVRSSQKWLSSLACLSFRSFPSETSITLSVRTSIFAYFGCCEAFFSWLTPLRDVLFSGKFDFGKCLQTTKPLSSIVSISSPKNTSHDVDVYQCHFNWFNFYNSESTH